MYFFVSWHTLTRKHNKYNVGDEVEALDVPGEDENEYFGSLSFSSLGSSKEQLVQSVSFRGKSIISKIRGLMQQ